MELTFGEMLLVGLKRQGLRYQDAAKALRVTKQAIQTYICGTHVPRSEEVVKCMAELICLDSQDTQKFLEKYKALREARYARLSTLKTRMKYQEERIKELEARVKELEGRE